jgi:monolysocardiolipin acyltransferase
MSPGLIIHLGFNELMPEGRSFPWKYMPRTGVNLSVNFGEPIPLEDIDTVLNVSVMTIVE